MVLVYFQKGQHEALGDKGFVKAFGGRWGDCTHCSAGYGAVRGGRECWQTQEVDLGLEMKGLPSFLRPTCPHPMSSAHEQPFLFLSQTLPRMRGAISHLPLQPLYSPAPLWTSRGSLIGCPCAPGVSRGRVLPTPQGCGWEPVPGEPVPWES